MHRFNQIAFVTLLALFGAFAIITPRPGLGQVSTQETAAELNCEDLPCGTVERGRAAFNSPPRKKLGGNGRACADCHMPSESFQLSPAAARARFDALKAKRALGKNADDP